MRIYNPGSVTLADDLFISNTGGSTNGSGAIWIQNVIKGTGNITFSNATTAISQAGSIFIFGFNNIFTGSVLVQKGTTTFNAAAAFGVASNTITLGQNGQGNAALLTVAQVGSPVVNNIIVAPGTGGTLTLGSIGPSSGVTYGGTFTLNGDLSLTSSTTGSYSVTLSNTISGSGGLTKLGTGIATLSGSNTFLGDTKLGPSSGTLVLRNTGALGFSTLNYTGSTLTFSSLVVPHLFTFGGLAGSANIALLDNASVPNPIALFLGANNASTTYSGVLSGTGSSIGKIGSGTLTLSGATGNTYSGGTTVNAGALLVTNTSGSGTGSGALTVNSMGTLGGSGLINAGGSTVTINPSATIRGGTGATASGALTVTGNLTLNSGSIIELALGAGGAHSTLARTAGTWTFDQSQAFTFMDLGAQTTFYDNIITGLIADPGASGWTITNPGWTGTFTYDGSGNIDLTLATLPASLQNVSTRGWVGTGDNVLIGGFIIRARGAPTKKQVAIRAIGPSLLNAGVPNFLPNTFLELHLPNGGTITNNDWKDNTLTDQGIITNKGLDMFKIVGMPPVPISNSESVIVAELDPGAYTAIVSGVGGMTGIALVEVYDLDAAVTRDTELANISTRGYVDVGNSVMIGGFIVGDVSVGGMSTARVVIRAIGPSLGGCGIQSFLADPKLELHDGTGAIIASNNDWTTNNGADQLTITSNSLDESCGQKITSLESVIVVQALPPGGYTAIVQANDNTPPTGVGLVGVYHLP